MDDVRMDSHALIRTFGTQSLEDLDSRASLLLVEHRHHRVGGVGHHGTEHTSCTAQERYMNPKELEVLGRT